MAKDQSPDVKVIHDFLKAKFDSLEFFTKDEMKSRVSSKSNFKTSWPKKIATLLIIISPPFIVVYLNSEFLCKNLV